MLVVMLLMLIMCSVIWVGFCKDEINNCYGVSSTDQCDCENAIVAF